MGKTAEIKFFLLFLISFFLHLVFFWGVILPDYHDLLDMDKKNRKDFFSGRDIIVNINQDNNRIINRKTLLSDKDSTAKGYITKKKGDRWLNNSLDFSFPKGIKKSSRSGMKKNSLIKDKILLSDNNEVVVLLKRFIPKSDFTGMGGTAHKILIPDKNDITIKNAIFYTNSGLFSFNTAKFKNFKYFKAMKDKIADNWILPGMANAIIGGYDPITGKYSTAPGWTRIMTVSSQLVKVFFTMNRDGEVLDVLIIDSNRNRLLDISCTDAIKLSKNFGKVPDDIKGDIVGIPFIFGYYVY